VSPSVSKAVLITGCSSGIGRATAEVLGRGGWAVYATARRIETIDDLATAGCRLVELDVCDEDSMHAAVDIIEREQGAVGALVVIEPGLVKTRFGETSVGALHTVSSDASPYRDFNTGVATVVGGRMRGRWRGWRSSPKPSLG
jgi:NAD(P)-dependent dehydrogenase (short-subunit alcohol dehydrogenase family)